MGYNVKNKIMIMGGLGLAFFVAGCARVNLPSNVTLKQNFIDTIDFSYQTDSPKKFSNIKLCIAENIDNNSVDLRDSSSSFVGPYTGNLYLNSQDKTIQGGDVFKYSEESTSTIIAKGSAIKEGLVNDIIKYDLKASVSGNNIMLKFYNITRAQQDTGFVKNDGFETICTLSGCRPTNAYEAIKTIADKLKACI